MPTTAKRDETHEQREDRLTVEAEINATIKFFMLELEELARTEPYLATDPHTFNRRRNRVIRKVWDTMKECMRYGARTAEREKRRE